MSINQSDYWTKRQIANFERSLDPDAYTLSKTVHCSPFPDDCIMLRDGERILTSEEAEDIIESIQRFYSVVPDSAIEEDNRRTASRALTRAEDKLPERKARPGFVYVISSDSGYWKIGRTRHPESRIATFHLMLPFRVNYEIVIPDKQDYVALERMLHERYEYCRADGEWFSLTDEDIEALKAEFPNVAEQYNG